MVQADEVELSDSKKKSEPLVEILDQIPGREKSGKWAC